jgi:glycosyltransferase involved in cell wall biosynthesis
LFLNPQPSDEVLAAIYSEGYYLGGDTERDRAAADAMKAETACLYVGRLVAYMGESRGRLLEIGCGHGHFLEAARAAGFEVRGTDISAHSCRAANQRLGGEFVFCGDAEQLEPPAELFDVCALFDAIEHMRNPVRLLERVRSFLKPGGVLFLCTPSLDSWSARMLKDRWLEFKVEHLCYFNEETIQNLLAKTAYGAVEISPNDKILTVDYIHRHFQRFRVAGVSGALATFRGLLPGPLRRKPFRIVASGMNVICRMQPARPRPLLSLIVPVYNEKRTFSLMMERLLAKTIEGMDRESLIVESNSNDGTREEVEKYRNTPGIKIIHEERPRGKGHAVRCGLQHATGDFVLIQDADLEYDVNDYDQLLEPLRNFSRAFVLGSRHTGSWKIRHFSSQPLVSTVMNLAHWFFTFLINLACSSSLKDPFTMYKVFRRDCLHGLTFRANRFDFDWELVIKLLRKGYVPLELPVNYESRSFGDGKKVSFFRDPLTWLWAVLRFRCERLYPRGRAKRIKAFPGAAHKKE